MPTVYRLEDCYGEGVFACGAVSAARAVRSQTHAVMTTRSAMTPTTILGRMKTRPRNTCRKRARITLGSLQSLNIASGSLRRTVARWPIRL
jgi:hypothetical protein